MRFIKCVLLACVTFSAIGAPAYAATTPALAAGVKAEAYNGWETTLCLDQPGGSVKVRMIPAVGGRILHYILNGHNVIWENPEGRGKTTSNTQGDFTIGGHQCDVGPELRGIPRHTGLWMGPYKWESIRPHTIRLTSETDAVLGVRLEREVVMDPTSGDLGIVQRVRNTTDLPVSFCLWDRTLVQGGGFALFPLKKKSRFAAGWAIRQKLATGKYIYDGASPHAPEVRIMDGVLVAKCSAKEGTKVGGDSDAGWIAYAHGKALFVKYFPYFDKGDYSDGGNSVELYYNDRFGELEPLSPEVLLRSGQSYAFPEKWILVELDEEVRTYEEARALVGRIPRSPFRK
jgi:hypothetical protein